MDRVGSACRDDGRRANVRGPGGGRSGAPQLTGRRPGDPVRLPEAPRMAGLLPTHPEGPLPIRRHRRSRRRTVRRAASIHARPGPHKECRGPTAWRASPRGSACGRMARHAAGQATSRGRAVTADGVARAIGAAPQTPRDEIHSSIVLQGVETGGSHGVSRPPQRGSRSCASGGGRRPDPCPWKRRSDDGCGGIRTDRGDPDASRALRRSRGHNAAAAARDGGASPILVGVPEVAGSEEAIAVEGVMLSRCHHIASTSCCRMGERGRRS